MKTYLFAFLCVLSVLISCDNDNKNLLRSIGGRWQVSSARFTNASCRPDSTATPSSTYWEFENCSTADNGNVANNCALTYSDGATQITFSYFVDAASDGPGVVNVRTKQPSNSADYERIAPFVLKSYTITQQSDNMLVLSCTDCQLGLGGRVPYKATEWILKR